jgi:transmembrane sensor
MTTSKRIEELVIRHLEGKLNASEQQELQDWMNRSPDNRKAVESFLDEDLLLANIRHLYQSKDRIWEKVQAALPDERPVRMQGWKRMFVVAAMLVVLVGSAWLFLRDKPVRTITQSTLLPDNDITAPQSTKAILTLDDGTTIMLDSAQNGTIATYDQTHIRKTGEGQISYDGNSSNSIHYNVLTNPRGSKLISLILNDGTRVWLNSESSLKYPTSFNGKERKVEITGEAYFEVTKNTSMPFIVSTGNTDIRVLGTHFNVNAYDDESVKKITLLEGVVKISKENNVRLLAPGQQALINESGKIDLIKNTDIDEVMAWKNGLFNFKKADMTALMKQVARWYNVEVVYEEIPAGTYSGDISRNTNLSNVLKILEYNGVHSRIENKKIIITK